MHGTVFLMVAYFSLIISDVDEGHGQSVGNLRVWRRKGAR